LIVPDFRRGPGRPRANCRSLVDSDFLLHLTWESSGKSRESSFN